MGEQLQFFLVDLFTKYIYMKHSNIYLTPQRILFGLPFMPEIWLSPNYIADQFVGCNRCHLEVARVETVH